MADNVTFLLGAGASYNALPVVSNWNERLKQFKDYLEEIKGGSVDNVHQRINLDEILKDIQTFLPEAEKHATIDTYAKKLFLRRNKGDDKKLLSLKHFLGCFFSFEQAQVSPGGLFMDFDNTPLSNRGYDGQELQVDPRYDVFFATLLNGQNKSLDDRVNIISWNYDLQLELAYTDFYKSENPQVQLKMFPNAYGTVLATGHIFQTIKLNGTAGLVHTKDGYPPIINRLKGDYFPKLEGSKLTIQDSHEFNVPTLEAMLTVYAGFLNRDPSIEPSIRFAWEEKSEENEKLKHAIELMSNTKTLVIIGYSFPNFNRSIDKELLKVLSPYTKIYYQDHKKAVSGLIQRLNGLLPYRADEWDIESYTDLKQFFIPYEL